MAGNILSNRFISHNANCDASLSFLKNPCLQQQESRITVAAMLTAIFNIQSCDVVWHFLISEVSNWCYRWRDKQAMLLPVMWCGPYPFPYPYHYQEHPCKIILFT